MHRYRTARYLLCVLLLCGCSRAAAPVPAGPQPASATPARFPTLTLAPIPTLAPTPTATATAVPATLAPTPTPAIEADLVLAGATLIDGTGGPPLPGAVLAIRGGRIVAVGRSGEFAFGRSARVVDLQGRTVLPGLINAHAHTDTLADDQLRAFTRAGVTTVRDLAGPPALTRRADALAGDPTMPRLLAAGPMVTVPGGHPIPIYGESEEVIAVSGPEQAAATVNRLIDAGADQIKIAVSGRTDVRWPELSDAEIRAICEAAHARGVRVTAHIDRAAALRRAVLNGLDDAAHMPRDRMPDDLIALMVERDVALIPTIDVYENLAEERGDGAGWRRATLPVMADNLRRFAAAGGTLALGDDYGNPGVALGLPHDEIEKWLGAGLTPMQVIVALTSGGALVCGIADQVGRLEPGMRADLLVVAGDPLSDMGALGNVALVLRDGQVAYAAPELVSIQATSSDKGGSGRAKPSQKSILFRNTFPGRALELGR
jgi:imidazolonepropionase-like amidohydrolase